MPQQNFISTHDSISQSTTASMAAPSLLPQIDMFPSTSTRHDSLKYEQNQEHLGFPQNSKIPTTMFPNLSRNKVENSNLGGTGATQQRPFGGHFPILPATSRGIQKIYL